MARSFNGTTQYLEYAGAVISGGAASFAGWMFLEGTTDLCYGPAVYNSVTNNFWHIRHVDTQGWGAVRASGANIAYRLQGSNSTVGWHHVCGTWAASSSALPSLYVDGVSITGTTVSATVTLSVDRTGVQTSIYSGRGYGKGRSAEQAIWAAELAAAEAIALYRGYTPLQIRPASLVAYWPLGGHYGQLDVDRWKNRYNLTPSGSPTWADHPRVIYPRRSFWFPSPIVAAPNVYTLEALPASVDVVGQSASLSAVRKLAAQPATIEVVGQEATLRVIRKIVASPATVDVVGQAATLSAVRRLAASPATIEVVGQAATLRVVRKIVASPATVDVVGQAANLRVVRRIVASPATVEVSGQTAVTRRTALLQGLAATIAVVGQAAVLTYSGEAAVVTEDWIGVDKATGRTPKATATHRVGTATAIGRVSKATAYQRPQ